MDGDINRLLRFGEDSREVEGIPEEKLGIAEAWARNICNDAVKPAVPTIISALGGLSGTTPKYKFLGNSELMLTIYSVPIEDRVRLQDIVADQSETIIETIKSHHGASLKSGGRNSESGTIRRTTLRSLSRLIAEKKVEYRGSKKTGGYYLK